MKVTAAAAKIDENVKKLKCSQLTTICFVIFFNSPSANRTPCFFLENSLCARIATSLMRNLSVNKRGILDSPVADGAERGRRFRSGSRRRTCFVQFFFCRRCCCRRRRRCFCHRLCHAFKTFVCVVFVVVVVIVVVVVVFVFAFCFFIFLFFFILLFSFPAGFVSVGNPIFPVLPIKNKNSAAVADLS